MFSGRKQLGDSTCSGPTQTLLNPKGRACLHNEMDNAACQISASARVEGGVVKGGGWKARGGLCGVQASAAYERTDLFYCMSWGEIQARVCTGRTNSHGAVARVEIWVVRSGEWKTCGGVCGVQTNGAYEPTDFFYCMAWS